MSSVIKNGKEWANQWNQKLSEENNNEQQEHQQKKLLICSNCNKIGHVFPKCPENECRNCKKKGHIGKFCYAPCGSCGQRGHNNYYCKNPPQIKRKELEKEQVIVDQQKELQELKKNSEWENFESQD